MSNPKTGRVHLTRRQMEVFLSLRDEGSSDSEFYQWRTIAPLLDHDLVSESDSGALRITRRGFLAERLAHNVVQFPEGSPAVCWNCFMEDACERCTGTDDITRRPCECPHRGR